MYQQIKPQWAQQINLILEVLLPMLTDCGLSVRKSRIQLQMEVSVPNRLFSFPTSLSGIIVFNVELNALKRILTKTLPVVRLDQYANCSRSSSFGTLDVMCLNSRFSKHFVVTGVSAMG